MSRPNLPVPVSLSQEGHGVPVVPGSNGTQSNLLMSPRVEVEGAASGVGDGVRSARRTHTQVGLHGILQDVCNSCMLCGALQCIACM